MVGVLGQPQTRGFFTHRFDLHRSVPDPSAKGTRDLRVTSEESRDLTACLRLVEWRGYLLILPQRRKRSCTTTTFFSAFPDPPIIVARPTISREYPTILIFSGRGEADCDIHCLAYARQEIAAMRFCTQTMT